MFSNFIQRKKITELLAQLKQRNIKVFSSVHRMRTKDFVVKTNKGDFVVSFLGELKLEKRGK